jgi:dephospho-CoA kinase
VRHRKVIAVTGSIGSGKSAVGSIFSDLGATVIDADQLARRALEPGSVGLQRVLEAFGTEYRGKDGSLDRRKLAELVFEEPDKLAILNLIVHPEVQSLFVEHCNAAQKAEVDDPIVYLVPLLFEAGLPLENFDNIVVVSCDQEVAIARVMERDKCSREHVLKRLTQQMDDSEKCARADYVISNNSDIAGLRQEVMRLYPLFRRR